MAPPPASPRPPQAPREWETVQARVRERAARRDPRERLLIPEVLRLAGRVRQRRVLDLGCGRGSLARVLASRGARVVGIDPSLGAIEQARLDAAEAGLAIELRTGSLDDARSLPRGSFDMVIALALDAPGGQGPGEAALGRIARLLRPTGRLVLGLPHPWGGGDERGAMSALFSRLRTAGLRVVDLSEPLAEPKERGFLLLLCERRRRRAGRSR